ncbi:MAG: hypothetical protein J6K42_03610 [Clostridia bacterium]|nr:hypothetical protein [Clostridia bacterium]
MNKTTAKNDIQVVLQEYIGNRKAKKVAEAVYEVMQAETQHTHNGKKFFINEDEIGALVLTMESMVKKSVEAILYQNLEEDEVGECLEQLMAESNATEIEKIIGIETIHVEGSDSKIYSELLEHKALNNREKEFMKNLRTAIEAGIKSFEVPVCDPSIDGNGKLQFIPGCKVAVAYSYNELEKLAEENSVRLGTKNEYFLFLGTILNRLIAEGWSERAAFEAVCTDSTELGHYANSADAKDDFELTGSRKIVGKCDLANACKILANDEKAGGFWLAGGFYYRDGSHCPLACLYLYSCYDSRSNYCVGWFVL